MSIEIVSIEAISENGTTVRLARRIESDPGDKLFAIYVGKKVGHSYNLRLNNTSDQREQAMGIFMAEVSLMVGELPK